MKFKIVSILLLFFLFLSTTINLNAQGCQNPVCQVMVKLNCSKDQAEKFLTYVSRQIGIVQITMSALASTKTPLSEKEEIIEFLLDEIFEEDAFVTISSSSNKEEIEKLPIKAYLNRLTNIKDHYNYQSARLFFHPKFLNLNGFEFDPDSNYYEMNILVKQYFMGENNGTSYKDLTYKNFACIISEIQEGEFLLKLKSIQAKRTLNISKEDLLNVQKDFKKFKQEFIEHFNQRR